MKAFIAGVITLTLLIGAVIANAFLIVHKTDDLIHELKALPDDVSVTDYSSFADKWESSRLWIALTVRRDNVDDIDDTLEQLKLCCEQKSNIGYLTAKEKLLCTVERLKETESFSLNRIF